MAAIKPCIAAQVGAQLHDAPPLKLVQLAFGEMAAAYVQHTCKHRPLHHMFNMADQLVDGPDMTGSSNPVRGWANQKKAIHQAQPRWTAIWACIHWVSFIAPELQNLPLWVTNMPLQSHPLRCCHGTGLAHKGWLCALQGVRAVALNSSRQKGIVQQLCLYPTQGTEGKSVAAWAMPVAAATCSAADASRLLRTTPAEGMNGEGNPEPPESRKP